MIEVSIYNRQEDVQHFCVLWDGHLAVKTLHNFAIELQLDCRHQQMVRFLRSCGGSGSCWPVVNPQFISS